ncbi:MAG: leucine-rich repeat domain-containing protein, partial [Clostridia bacterium]|nr:leucine-rich repeat domain-containing protein [Clostridia bacterium]
LIGAGAFKNCTNLRELIFEEGEGGAATLEIGANAFDGCSSSYFETIVLPAKTTKVGDSAFANMSYLKYVTLNEGLTEISNSMFYNDTRLYDITVPASVTSIGESAFYRCGYMPDSFAITFAENSQLKRIEPCAFESVYTSSTGKTVELPEGVTYIGYKAFYGANFQNVTIPSTVTFIGAEAFASSGSYSAALRSVTFASNGTQDLILGGLDSRYINRGNSLSDTPRPYEGRVFYNQSKLTSIELPERVTFIGEYTFYQCEGLESISFGENSKLKHIGDFAFQYMGAKEITIPNSVSNGNVTVDASGNQQFRIGIGTKAFYGMKNVEVINFEDGGTLPLSFGDAAFYYLSKLTTVNLPSRVADYVNADGDTVRGITERVFAYITSDGVSQGQDDSNIEAINIAEGGSYYCSIDGVVYTADKSILVVCPMGKTGKVTVDSHVALIEARAFKSSKASSIEFEGGTVDMVIGESAFASAKLIEEIVLPNNVVEIKDEAFAYCEGLTTITLSKNLKEFNSNMFKGTSMPIIVTEGSDGFVKKDGVVFTKDMKTLVLYAAALDSESYTVPNGVTAIGANAFKANSSLKTLILPDGLKEIGDNAFYGAMFLSNLEIPNTVERIGEYAFTGCSSLGTVSFKKGGTQMLVFEKYAFSQANISSMVLPSRLSSIGAYAFYGCSALESLTFEANSKLDSIDTFAFWNCRSLETLELPGVNKLGNRAFNGCTGLVSVTIAEGLNSLGDYVFAGCENLESVSFPASLHTMGAGVFGYPSGSAYCPSLKFVTFAKGSQLEVIPVNTFTGCTALERITIPASVKSIESRPQDGDYASSTLLGAFQGCTALTLVAFEDGSKIEKIGAYAFAKCESLSSFTIPSTVSVLEERAFTGCSSLKEMTIPSTTTVYGRYLFENCSSLTKVVLSEKATTLPNGMFMNCPSLKQIEIPDSVSSFGSSLFYNTGFETFTVPEKITNLPDSFLANSKITSVVLPDGLTSIGRGSFSGCANLKSIVIPNGVTIIDSSAFENCTSLASVTLPAQLETIGSSAFRSCSSLTSITIPSNVRLIDYRAFDGCVKLVEVFDLSELKLEEGINTTANGYVAGYAVKVLKQGEESMLQYTKDGFVLIENNGKLMVLGYNGSASKITLPSDAAGLYDMAFVGASFTEVTIPASFTEIANGAFKDCANLQKVVINGELITIGENAFQNCVSLSSINIPNSVTTIGKYAFDKCAGLTSLSLPTSLTTLGLYAFQDCSGIEGDIVIPNAVTRIEGSVFKNCSGITSVKLPSSMSYLGSYAFDGCTSLTAFEMDGGQNDYFKVHEGALINLNEYGKVRLKYVPLAKTGTFTVPADVTFTSSDGSLFAGSHLDVLMLEARTNKISEYGIFYTGWLGNATVKAVVISTDAFSKLPNDAFKTWTSEQTIYFVQSESEISKVWSGSTNANVVYDYVVPGTETELTPAPEE